MSNLNSNMSNSNKSFGDHSPATQLEPKTIHSDNQDDTDEGGVISQDEGSPIHRKPRMR